MKARVLVSACLLGQRVRYDGGAHGPFDHLEIWRAEGRVVPVCPEVSGGLGVPRPPAEIVGGSGADVHAGNAAVVTEGGVDVSEQFRGGAEVALELARRHDVRVAVLKERSPSCGSSAIYDGSFSRTLMAGDGVTTALLRQHGIEVFGESELDAADARLRELDRE